MHFKLCKGAETVQNVGSFIIIINQLAGDCCPTQRVLGTQKDTSPVRRMAGLAVGADKEVPILCFTLCCCNKSLISPCPDEGI